MAFSFHPQDYGPVCQSVISRDEPNELGPGTPDRGRLDQLRELNTAAIFSDRQVTDRDMAACCLSALWLRHNFLEESHKISQDIGTATGSYWHGIMHRREPDFSNAKYWFRRVGEHTIWPDLNEQVKSLVEPQPLDDSSQYLAGQSDWDAFRFVDLCQASIAGRANESLCRQIAELEWQMLFDHCYRRAIS